MINLLPPEVKQDYAYALRNTGLRRWVAGFLLGLAGLGIIATYGLVTMHRSINSYTDKVATAQATLKKEKLTQTEAQVQDITDNLRLVDKVLSQEVLFSKLLKQIATVIPANSVLTSLNISQATSGVDIAAAATDYGTATQVQVNLADPANKIFSKADIVSISCQSANNPHYPCTVQIRALFNANNPFLFINNSGS